MGSQQHRQYRAGYNDENPWTYGFDAVTGVARLEQKNHATNQPQHHGKAQGAPQTPFQQTGRGAVVTL